MRLTYAILSLSIFSSVRSAAVLAPVELNASRTVVDEPSLVWPGTAQVPRYATRAPGDWTNAERLRRGLPIAKPRTRRVKRLLPNPATASGYTSAGQITRYTFKQCQQSVSTSSSSMTYAFNPGQYDGTPQDLANRCASLQQQQGQSGSGSGYGSGFGGSTSSSSSGFAVSIDPNTKVGTCMCTVTVSRFGSSASQTCTQSNSAYYAPA